MLWVFTAITIFCSNHFVGFEDIQVCQEEMKYCIDYTIKNSKNIADHTPLVEIYNSCEFEYFD